MAGPVGVGEAVAGPVGLITVELVALPALYRLSRLAEPQNSVPFPAQTMLQSVAGAGTEPAARVLSQYCDLSQ